MTLAYMAGFFDGEGCVNFAHCRTSCFPRVLLVNTDRSILEAFQKRFGGDIKALSLRRAGWKVGWQWRLSWRRAVDFLDAMSPYLRLKQRQAHTVFAWAAIAPGRGARWDTPALALLKRRMHWLNRKGPSLGDGDPAIIAMTSSGRYVQPSLFD